MSYHFLYLVLLLLHALPSSAINEYNATVDYDQAVCTYRLSGQYGLLPRLLHYILLVFVAIGRKHIWLITGAIAYVLTYSGTAVVHSFVLSIASRGYMTLTQLALGSSSARLVSLFNPSSSGPMFCPRCRHGSFSGAGAH